MEKMRDKVIEIVNEEVYSPVTKEELAAMLDINSKDIHAFYNLINEMEKEVYICISKKDRILPPSRMGLFVGRFISHRKGFGFINADCDGIQDLYIPVKDVNGAIHNDRVIAEITQPISGDRRAEGRIIKVVKREVTEIVGLFQPNNNFGFVTPDDTTMRTDVYIPKKFFNDARENDKVVCEITMWAKGNRKPEGKIIEIIGQKGARGVEIDSIVKAHGLPVDFPEKVLDEAEFVIQPISEEDIENRLDLREEQIFTIDGEDAKDLDDAISVEVLDNGNYKLGVHIADVTNYVKEKGKLDKEALKRATSVYLVDKVIPMLPKALSNGVCSLNPFEDKLTLSVVMEINRKGDVVKYDIKESIINSKARLSYTEVSDILEKDDENLKLAFSKLLPNIKAAEELATILMGRRNRRGALDFNFPEANIILNKHGRVENIKPYERRIANKIIEEFMLITNETVAEHFYWLGIPFVYRIHETPSSSKMEDFNNFINPYGYLVKGDLEEIHPKSLQTIIKKIKGSMEEEVINTIMLRSLKQAKYSPECSGHFGLAAKYYCHFTSPIRRYPDLQIHRIIKEFINNKLNSRRQDKLGAIVEYASTQSSERERAAEVAEREVHDFYKCLFMEDKIGNEYEGIVSSTTAFGMFIKLENTVEGLVRIADLTDDFYIHDDVTHTIAGQGTGKVFKIGDKVRIKVDNVNIDVREINFKLLEN